MEDRKQQRVELEPLLGAAGAWNAGKPIRGARTIVVDGEVFGSIRMVGHGCHGVTFEFYDVEGEGVPSRYQRPDGSWKYSTSRLANVSGKRTGRKAIRDNDPRENDERIADAVRVMIADGQLPAPAAIEWANAESTASYEASYEKRRERRFEMREALRSLDRRTDLTNLERLGLRAAFEEIFSAAIDAGGVVV